MITIPNKKVNQIRRLKQIIINFFCIFYTNFLQKNANKQILSTLLYNLREKAAGRPRIDCSTI